VDEKRFLTKTNSFELTNVFVKKLSKDKNPYKIIDSKEFNTLSNLMISRVYYKKIKLIISNDYNLVLEKKQKLIHISIGYKIIFLGNLSFTFVHL